MRDGLETFLRCGVFAHGFLRAHCDECGNDLLVAFSCKGRGICPSCAGRRMANTAAHLVDRVLPVVPVRQWVLSLPHELRRLAAFDARALTAFDRIFVEQILAHHRRVAGRNGLVGARGGAVTFVQRFGGSLNLHVHFHVVVLDGAFERRASGAVFHEAPPPTSLELDEILHRTATRIARWLRRHDRQEIAERVETSALDACADAATHPGVFAKLTDDTDHETDDTEPPKSRLVASCSGFNLHAGVRMSASDDVGRERLCRYGARPALASKNLRRLPDGRFAYRTKYARRGQAHHRIMTPMELLARLAALIPPPRHPLVRYHGVLAPHSAWRAHVVPRAPADSPPPPPPPHHVPTARRGCVPVAATAPASNTRPLHTADHGPPAPSPAAATSSPCPSSLSSVHTRDTAVLLTPNILAVAHWSRIAQGLLRASSPRINWPTLLRRTFTIDVLRCPRCSGSLHVLAALTNPETVHALLEHLDISTPPAPARARDPTDLLDPLLDS